MIFLVEVEVRARVKVERVVTKTAVQISKYRSISYDKLRAFLFSKTRPFIP